MASAKVLRSKGLSARAIRHYTAVRRRQRLAPDPHAILLAEQIVALGAERNDVSLNLLMDLIHFARIGARLAGPTP